MRESIGNVFFFGTYEITRSYLFSCFGLDASRRSKAALGDAEPVSMQASFSDALLETGIGIVTGGLAGTVVSNSHIIKCLVFITGWYCHCGLTFDRFVWPVVQFWLSVLPLDVAKTRIQTAIDLNVNRNPFYQIRLVSYAIDCPANPFQHCILGLMPQVTQFFGCAGLQASWSESPVCRDRSYFGSSIPSQCCCNCDMGVDCSIVEYWTLSDSCHMIFHWTM